MSHFGPIAYEDFSQLNAMWGQARPPMAGLGASGSHEYVDVSYLNARLNPIMPKQVGMGNGSLSGNALGIVAGLGADPDYPWREYSADTKALQEATNEALRARGYATLTADGKLGPRTCGAVRKLCSETSQDCDAPSTCQSFEDPVKLVSSSTTAKKTTTPTTSRASTFGGGTNWLLIGGAVAAIAVGGALIFRAKK